MLELVLRLVLSLGVVLGLFWVFARHGSRKLGSARSALRVRGRQALGRSASVAVVEVGNRVLVIGVGEGGVRLLTELDPAELEVAEPATVTDDPGPEALAPGSPLGGSLLATQTWKQAWAAASSKVGVRPTARDSAGEPVHD
jgi:flagellar protein FliO/FliZ